MSDIMARFAALPAYGIGALVVLLSYAIETEVRFGARARSTRAGTADRNSTLALSLASVVAILSFALGVKAQTPGGAAFLPAWFRHAVLPGMPFTAWCGVSVAAVGVALRLWAVLQLRERFTRTLLILDQQKIERGGPYRWVRHPGYLGSLLCLNGVPLASGNWIAFLASLAATIPAYAYRIKVEDQMLIAALGQPYVDYRDQTNALLPLL
jgi:protein-S-isoprenylcysteine O-methyltransferase Ste14